MDTQISGLYRYSLRLSNQPNHKSPPNGQTDFLRGFPGLQPLMDYICSNGFEHHVAMNRGHSADVLAEALGKYMGVDVYCHHGKGAIR
ncbi:hypothetical protein [Extibacter muris]|nr:hypothetical protein [Extibacter muris]MCU0079669.1 hypothetical protein [Extibacter muris]